MTRQLISLFSSVLIVTMFIGCSSDDSETQDPIFEVGDIGPAGGIVFYDKGEYSNGWRYIEAAPQDIPIPNGTTIEWGCFNNAVADARNIPVGSGQENTDAILAFHNTFDNYYENPEQCSDVSNGTVAAKLCDDFEITNEATLFDDWFLPSEGEMKLMYENLHLQGMGGFDTNNILYWTSTEHDDNTATSTDFSNGDQGWLCKQCGFDSKVRAARYF